MPFHDKLDPEYMQQQITPYAMGAKVQRFYEIMRSTYEDAKREESKLMVTGEEVIKEEDAWELQRAGIIKSITADFMDDYARYFDDIIEYR